MRSGGPQIGPHDAAELDRRVGGDVHLVAKLVFFGFVELVDAGAGDIELPSVIDAAQPTFFVATEEQRGTTVRAIFVQQTDAAVRVAEGDEVLA